MQFKDFIQQNGLKICFLSKKLGVTRQTLHRVCCGEKISPELATRIHTQISEDIDLVVSNSYGNHIRRRKVALE